MMSYLPYIVLIFRRQRSCYHFILLSSFALGRKEKICPSALQKNAPYRTQRICFGKLRKRLTTIFSKAYFKLFFFNSLVRKFVALCDVFKGEIRPFNSGQTPDAERCVFPLLSQEIPLPASFSHPKNRLFFNSSPFLLVASSMDRPKKRLPS